MKVLVMSGGLGVVVVMGKKALFTLREGEERLFKPREERDVTQQGVLSPKGRIRYSCGSERGEGCGPSC